MPLIINNDNLSIQYNDRKSDDFSILAFIYVLLYKRRCHIRSKHTVMASFVCFISKYFIAYIFNASF
jgi:hypothetical protein